MEITDTSIRDRFVLCLNELDKTLDEIAEAIGCHKPYLSALKTNDNPKIPSLTIAKFCHEYGYSPYYILLGEGPKKSKEPRTREERLIDAQGKRIDVLADIISEMMKAIIELKPVWTSETKNLAQKAKREIKN